MRKIFVTGIGTSVGKTIVSSIIVEALKADYWKPVQAGNLNNTDSMVVSRLISNKKSRIHSESYSLTQPISPHAASKIDNLSIEITDIKVPNTSNTLIIEGAGGLMVPLNEKQLVIDMIKYLQAEVILVSQNYLGSINHTLLSVEALNNRNAFIKGIIFNGKPNADTEKIILKKTNLEILGNIYEAKKVNKEFVLRYSKKIKI